jgi:CRISPR system Cascade subunit CasA
MMHVACVRAKTGKGTGEFTLPGTFAALMRDEIESFPALRPHQRQAWHAFLAQLGTLALQAADRTGAPKDESGWATLLRELTPDYPADEPWSLVAPSDRPALLQPAIPSGDLGQLKNVVSTPDALDMLVTAKNHDLKAEVMAEAAPDDWLFALVTLQTMEGFLGAGNYGTSRMNGGFANRTALGIVPANSLGKHLQRDIERLLALRKQKQPTGYAPTGGLGLVWLRPWDGVQSIRQVELDPYYIDVCRRVRLVEVDGRLEARAGGSKVPRVVPVPGGLTGDPWAPVVREKDGSQKVFTADAQGFGYRRMVRLMFPGSDVEPAPLQGLAQTDAPSGLALVARALTRGQGKTEGYHERRIPISNTVRGRLGRPEDTDAIARAAQERVLIAGEIQNRILKSALLALFENGPDKIDYRDDGAERRTAAFLRRFDEAVDRDFFPRLWEEFEEGADSRIARSAWVRDLLSIARDLLDQAARSGSRAAKRKFRARARAEAVLYGAPRRNPHISPFLGDTA